MKLLQVGVVVAALMLSGSVAFAQPTLDGQVHAISVHCEGAVPDTCSGTVDVEVGVGSGAITRVFIPAGMQIQYGGRQLPVTALEVGDHVRIDLASTAPARAYTAASATIVDRTGALKVSNEDQKSGF